MIEVVKGRLFQCSVAEANALVSPESMGAYARHGIACVLTVGHDVRPRCVAVLAQLCLPVSETAPAPPAWFDLACGFVRAFPSCLVHCNAGANRSRVFAAAVAHGVWSVSLDDALKAADVVHPHSEPLRSMLAWAKGAR